MEKNPYHAPKLEEVGNLRDLVQGESSKTAAASDANGGSERAWTRNIGGRGTAFQRGETSSDEAAGRGGRGG